MEVSTIVSIESTEIPSTTVVVTSNDDSDFVTPHDNSSGNDNNKTQDVPVDSSTSTSTTTDTDASKEQEEKGAVSDDNNKDATKKSDITNDLIIKVLIAAIVVLSLVSLGINLFLITKKGQF